MAGKSGKMTRIVVNEISLVDKAANKRKFAFIKRKSDMQKMSVAGAAIAGAIANSDKWNETIAADLPLTQDELTQVIAGNSDLLTLENVEAIAVAVDLPADELIAAAGIQVANDEKIEGSTEVDAAGIEEKAKAVLAGETPADEPAPEEDEEPEKPEEEDGDSEEEKQEDMIGKKADMSEVKGALNSIKTSIEAVLDEIGDDSEEDDADKDGEDDAEVAKSVDEIAEACLAVIESENSSQDAKEKALVILEKILG